MDTECWAEFRRWCRRSVEAIDARGGVIEYGAAVERLLTDGGAVVGVVLAGGGKRSGRSVVVNADVGWLRDGGMR